MGALLDDDDDDDDDEWRTGNGYSGVCVVFRAVARVLFFTQVKERGL